MDQGSVFQVAIDFKQSHLFFPHIIEWVMLVLGLLIAVVHGREIAHSARRNLARPRDRRAGFDGLRFLGTLALLVVYFVAMDRFGELFPNEGYGFLFMSMPFMLALSLLYVHDLDRRKLAIMSAAAIVAPLTAWYVLGRLFWITLP